MLEYRNIGHAYGGRVAIEDVTLTARPGEVTCLFGPSGCGKTTLLRLAAGLMPVQRGEIHLDGEVIAGNGRHVTPENRSVGLVFQEGALFPHLSVAQNIGFGLHDTAAVRQARVAELLDLVDLAGFGRRYPHTLSGGQQQRVALARALAPAPRVLLFDEPYASLDTQLRRDLRAQARRMVRRTGTIGIVVSHDPDEVMEMADTIAVLDSGRLQQAGAPAHIFDNPATANIAAMFGDGQLVRATLEAAALATDFGSWPADCLTAQAPSSGPVMLVVRPHALALEPDEAGLPVIDLRLAGPRISAHVETPEGQVIRAALERPASVEIGQRVRPVPKPGSVFAFPA